MILRLVIDQVNGKNPVIAGVGAPSTRETITLARDAEDMNVDGLLIVSPYFYKPNSTELFSHYARVISATDLPVLLYNVPRFTGYNLDVDLIERIVMEFEQVVGIKDSGGAIGQISELAERVGKNVSLFAGTADVFLPSLCLGAKGAILAISNVVPQLCVDLYNYFRHDEFEKARQISVKLLRLNDILVKKYNQISAIKEAMNQLGRPAGFPRGPSLPLDNNARNEIKAELTSLGIE
jgi:4-hydroxy-tetrahydrodipicolinate synthase